MAPPGFADVVAAAARIAGAVHRTPVHTSATLDAELSASVFFKCENLQKVGAFKARGATNAVLALRDADAARGVVTHSSGNHGAAVAYAARLRGIRAIVVMPDDAPAVKLDAVRGYGARVVQCARSQREATTAAVQKETGATLVHPFEDPYVIAGQATAALELLEDAGPLDVLVAPIGGGGLLAGTALVVRELSPKSTVVGAEPAAVDDAFRSLRDGVRHPGVQPPRSIADGLLTGIGENTFAILRAAGAAVITVSEDAILAAALFFLQRMKIVVEPSSATVLAAMRAQPARFAGKRIGAILTGGNTDLAWLSRAPVGGAR